MAVGDVVLTACAKNVVKLSCMLAVGAVVLTGGAALGVLPALGGAGGLLAGIGISGPLAGIMTSAASAATMGAVTSGLTGGNIVKGATTGLVVGGLAGGLGAAAGGLGSKAAAAAGGSGSAGGSITGFATPAEKFVSAGANAMNTAGNVAASTAPAAVATGGGGLGSGVLSFLNNNPVVAGSLVQGIGAGISGSAQAKEARRAEEREAARYSDTSQLFRLGGNQANSAPQESADGEDIMRSPIPYADASFVYDKNTGKIRLVKGA